MISFSVLLLISCGVFIALIRVDKSEQRVFDPLFSFKDEEWVELEYKVRKFIDILKNSHSPFEMENQDLEGSLLSTVMGFRFKGAYEDQSEEI